MATVHQVREGIVASETEVSLPADVLAQLGWEAGTKLVVNVVDKDTVILARRPENASDRFAGKLGHVFGDHEEVMRYLEEERNSWEPETR
jgi:bifunctional DNA-binding transcriptional regulator/antitoxin component of YhaV-PrlF toxin-antitoxin module